jgi:predicted membrane GTPase involved in stress response
MWSTGYNRGEENRRTLRNGRVSDLSPEILTNHGYLFGYQVNVCKKKAATNVRSNKDATVVLNEPKSMSLDDAVEYLSGDEMVEVTPLSVRIAKNPKMDPKRKAQ